VENEERKELLEEYYKLAAIVQGYDSYFLTIKEWGVTASGAALGFAVSQAGHAPSPLVPFVALALPCSFWFTEVRFKLFQLGHMRRIAELENALQNGLVITAPRIFAAFGEESTRNIHAKRWRSVAFWPQVMLPHAVFVGMSCILAAIALARR
jgi:hypothetical protein